MSLRDWLDLLFVPVFIAIGAAALGGLQACAQMQTEEQRAEQEAVQAYLGQMGKMLLNKDRSLRDSKEGDEVRTLAQSRTLAVLDGLGSDLGTGLRNKRTIITFLYENSLIDKDNPIISLREADLTEADLNYMDLSDADLPFVDLKRANLDHADLDHADLGGAHLEDVYLSGANLSNANLNHAYLNDADLYGADLDSAYLKYADLRGANLEDANLSAAYMGNANLSRTSLLGGIGGAFLLDVMGVADSPLAQRTRALGLATMTDGTTVHAGHYVTDEFVRSDTLGATTTGATLSLEAGEDWKRDVNISASSKELYLEGPGGGLLIFTSPRRAFDPSNLSEPKETSAPKSADAWATWFEEHPKLDSSKQPPVSVDGKTGVRIDVTPVSGLEKYPRDSCDGGQPCVFLYEGPSDYSRIAAYKDWTDRLTILDVEGETVIIDISAKGKANGKEFKTFFSKAQQVLDSVEWGSP